MWLEYIINKCLKGNRVIREAKRQQQPLRQPKFGFKINFIGVRRGQFGALKVVHQIINSKKGIIVLDVEFIEIPIISD